MSWARRRGAPPTLMSLVRGQPPVPPVLYQFATSLLLPVHYQFALTVPFTPVDCYFATSVLVLLPLVLYQFAYSLLLLLTPVHCQFATNILVLSPRVHYSFLHHSSFSITILWQHPAPIGLWQHPPSKPNIGGLSICTTASSDLAWPLHAYQKESSKLCLFLQTGFMILNGRAVSH